MRVILGAVCSLLLASLLVAETEPVTIAGELIDTYCYAGPSIRGDAHRACAVKCVRAGVPAGLLDPKTRKVYILLPAKDASALPPNLVAQMGHDAAITGEVFVKGGATFLTVQSFRITR